MPAQAPPRRGGNNGPSYASYDDEVSQQVIPAVAKRQGAGSNNLPKEAFQRPMDMDL
jgi:hypothetical protein